MDLWNLSRFWDRLVLRSFEDIRLDANVTRHMTRGGSPNGKRRGAQLWVGTVNVKKQPPAETFAIRAALNGLSDNHAALIKLPNIRSGTATISAASGRSITLTGLDDGDVIEVGTRFSYQTSGGVYMCHEVTFGGTRTVSGGAVALTLSNEVAPSGVVGQTADFSPVLAVRVEPVGIGHSPALDAAWSFTFEQVLEAF